MKLINELVNIFGKRLVSWRFESDLEPPREIIIINLNDEPTEQEKAAIVENYQSLYPDVFIIENHHTRESDFQLRVYSR
jgi:hypothetical protein